MSSATPYKHVSQSLELEAGPNGFAIASLNCPHCGGNNLHQTYAHAFSGKHLIGSLHMDRPWEDTENNDVGAADNPSERAGLLVDFQCETCDEPRPPVRLAVFQADGVTYLNWVKHIK